MFLSTWDQQLFCTCYHPANVIHWQLTRGIIFIITLSTLEIHTGTSESLEVEVVDVQIKHQDNSLPDAKELSRL